MKTERSGKVSLHKYSVMMIIFMLLVGCGRTDYPAATLQPETIRVQPSLVPPTVVTTAVVTTVPTATPQTSPPVLDGVLAPGEWDTAVVEYLSDGSELLLLEDDDYLYLGIRSVTLEMIGANVFVEAGGQVRILHTSAALGTAVYQQNNGIWQQTQNFDWQCRDTTASATAQAERAAYLQENQWLAANARMGTPNELEYQIAKTNPLPRLAISVFRSSAPDERMFWPSALDDDTLRSNPGGLPAEMHFAPEKWAEWH